jgi:hypothetical protein
MRQNIMEVETCGRDYSPMADRKQRERIGPGSRYNVRPHPLKFSPAPEMVLPALDQVFNT